VTPSRTITALATLVLWVAIVVFSAVGLSGIFFGAWEFSFLPTNLETVSGDRTTFLNQVRFLKALELAAGIMIFSVRREFFERRTINRAVVALLWVTPLARVASLALDGVPHWTFVALLGVELSGATVVALYSIQRFGFSTREPITAA